MNKITMKDIAEKVGVSKTTVSLVINKKADNISEETKNKIYEVIEETGYIPNNVARGLKTKKSGSIAIIMPDILNPFFSELSRAIEDFANKLGYNVFLCNSDNNANKEKRYVKLLISKLIDGIILIPGQESEDSANLLKLNDIPFVFVDRYIKGYEDYPGVYFDNKQGIQCGVEYLYGKNKRNIVFVTGPKKMTIYKERIDGYKESMTKYGIYNKSLIFESTFTLEGGMEVTNHIIDECKSVDAIFYSNDVMAIGGMKTLKRRGYKIPEDIVIMGFDGITLSKMIEPELTTIQQPIYSMGEQACRLIIDIIKGESIDNLKIHFPPRIIVRGTT
ncbi:LacI family DNA-binding transcriptional regulator [Clostridium estertheticum]|uniref:LacI family transcriptional regulator n=1 Tax=Clostridium estertheticum subsp. estertheticum TaxID=1552 RepID=A0A1J0GLZ9_9CLOT|nr:LacI family DNA-binding transcriptional regulator [Clostridium estertheticum]APC41910.1 LacI family transcriptional regulator [Clostridium estertheticum subsp. estertheticum]MBU3073235.1 LacI family transcriptional regulator [Clostridium estertheticum]MBU3163524.1 LacI family transcriptional regulator [Clostridium estertheticum]MBU3185232.1 LacI family transcriptional regulator [Clostridium estertheticum]MBZ9616185.1 LacI family transcriptional regulator [Clostridium estertheticum subsp. la